MKRKTFFGTWAALGAAITVIALWPASAVGQVDAALARRISRITERPEFAHSRFGIQFYSMDSGKVVYELNAQQLFVPGSTTKLFTEGTALELLGADYRFHTRIYRTGPVDKDGTLNGDLILVAAGDPNLSNRIQSDGTLVFEDEDHSYGGPDSKGLPGDPLVVIRELAQKVAASKIKKINGRVLVDASLFPEGERELGTGVVLSPIVVNDNVIDVVATPGASEGAPVTVKSSPQTGYVSFVNQATTGKAGSQPTYDYSADKTNPDGTHVVTITGTLPPGPAAMVSYRVPEPKRFATVSLVDALKEKGVACAIPAVTDVPDFKALAVSYKPENLVAEHVSPPLKEEVKVTLKVSQNLHASMTPSVLGAVLGHADKDIDQAGFDLENGFLKRLGLDLTGAVQSDGAGGNAFYTPDFVVRYLLGMSKQKDFQDFYHALPILGKDGTLVKIQVKSPAAGHVHAKTGTFSVYDALNKKLMVTGKGLSGYMDTASGEHLILALYANMVSVPVEDPEATQKIVGEALGEIASAAYDLPRGAQDVSAAAGSSGSRADGEYDVIIRNGKIIDGSGGPWAWGDIGIRGDRIAAIGKLEGAHAGKEIDAKGLVVSPGFIDMLGQSEQALLIDNRSLSKLSQGITTEITGEGGSIAPQNEKTLVELKPAMDHYNVTVDWKTLDEYYKRLQKLGTPLNIGTYVGAAQVREAVLGDVDRKPNAEELEQMKALVDAGHEGRRAGSVHGADLSAGTLRQD